MDAIRKTHPMILVAAASVTVLSLAGVATLAGWLPAAGAQPAAPLAPLAPLAAEVTTSTSAKVDSPTTLSIPAGAKITVEQTSGKTVARSTPRAATPTVAAAPKQGDPGYTRVATQPVNDNGIYVENARTSTPAAPAVTAVVCNDCGTVQSIQEITNKGEGTGLGAVAGGVLGGLAGSQIGGGNGKTVMAVLGAVGGAFAGHEVEKRVRADKQYQITVRFDDGRVSSFTDTAAAQWQNGDRVRLENGQLLML